MLSAFRFDDGSTFAIEDAVIFDAFAIAREGDFFVIAVDFDVAFIDALGRVGAGMGKPGLAVEFGLHDHVDKFSFSDIASRASETADINVCIGGGLGEIGRDAGIVIITGCGAGDSSQKR